MPTRRIDLNCDLGESFGAFQIGQDEPMLEIVSSANIACGYHAGDHNVMARTVARAVERGVALGAHPGLPDLVGFGRRAMPVSPDDVYAMVVYQAGSLAAFARLHGQHLQHVKPHGALYQMAEKDTAVAGAIAAAVRDLDAALILYGLAGGQLVRAGQAAGLRVAQEVFADRTYQPDGMLTPRADPNALIHDPTLAARRMVRLAREGTITAVDGTDLALPADTICVHGDEPTALLLAQALRRALTENGVEIRPFGAA